MNKPRVLFHSEWSALSTGYSVYTKNILSEMAKSGKYELAEFSSYCGITEVDGAPNNLANNQNDRKVYDSDHDNVYGKWRFERVLLDFKPDFVLCCRDYWMDQHIF